MRSCFAVSVPAIGVPPVGSFANVRQTCAQRNADRGRADPNFGSLPDTGRRDLDTRLLQGIEIIENIGGSTERPQAAENVVAQRRRPEGRGAKPRVIPPSPPNHQ